MTADLHSKLDQMVSQEAASLEFEHLHLSPYYGETYAEVVNLAAGLDFNFVFAWGPLLLPHERILIEVLVYLAREQARGNAFQTQMGGERREMPIEIYLEKVPMVLQERAREANQRLPLSLAQLTNLHRLKIYDALKSPRVHHFVIQEPAQRVFLDGRIMTGPARFRVRVDPVPTPEQGEDIRMRLAQRMVKERLLVMSGIQTSLKDPAESPSSNSVMSLRETSIGDPERSLTDSLVMSGIQTSLPELFRIQNPNSVMSLWETSGDARLPNQTIQGGEKPTLSVMSGIQTSQNGPLVMSGIETSVMSGIETSVMSGVETSRSCEFRSQTDVLLMSDIETSLPDLNRSQTSPLVMSGIETSVMSGIETSLMSGIETSPTLEFESESSDSRCLPERRHIDVSMFLMQKHRYRNVPEARASATHSETEGIYNSVKEKARNLAAKHSGTHSVANPITSPSISPAADRSTGKPAAGENSRAANENASPDCAHQASTSPLADSWPADQSGEQPDEASAKFAARRPRTTRDGESPPRRNSLLPPATPPRSPSASSRAEAANSIAPVQKLTGRKLSDRKLPDVKLPGDDGRENVERWRRETEDLARQSAEALDDQRSLGYHIKVWHHARKVDQQRGGAAQLTSGVFDILNELTRRRHEADSPRPQGKIWTLRTRKWFDENGFPLLVKADEAELEAVRAALADDFGGIR